MATKKLFQGTIVVIGAVIGLVLIADLINTETYDPSVNNSTGTFSEDSLSGSILNYIVPILALVVLSAAATVYKIRS